MPFLHYYRCASCRSGRVTTFDDARQRCAFCGSYLSFQESSSATPEEWTRTRTHDMSGPDEDRKPLEPWTCVRCGVEFADERPKYRLDGRSCRACVEAEGPQQRKRIDRLRRDLVAQEDQERMDAAYRALEGKR